VYPIALDLRSRLVVVAGGGPVAERKVRGLLEAGARVRVVAPATVPSLREAADRGELELRLRSFEPADLAGARLAFAATDVPEVNAAVVDAARVAGVPVNDASGSVPDDFSSVPAHRAGPLTFTVDTGGLAPSFARRLIAELGERYDERYARAALALGRARDYAKTVVPADFRAAVMEKLAGREIGELAAMNPSTVENEVEAVYASLAGNGTSASEPFLTLVCATRASALAMWQTRHVIATFAKAGLVSTILQISTKGDRVQDRSLAALGTDSIFVKELELALREKRADYAVHSCKDLPSTLPEDMSLAAIGPRADPRDAFCSERYASLEALPPGALVGTSSPRRRAQLQALRPDLRFETIRGNVDTRLRKLREGEFDAILLAVAGLSRLGLSATHTVPISPEVLIPAVGQGALAIEVRAADTALAERIHGLFADPATEIAVRAERAFLRTLRGGCQAPVGAHGVFVAGRLSFRAAIAAPDGSAVVRGSVERELAEAAEAERVAVELAHRLLDEGGAALLDAAAEPLRAAAPLSGLLFLLPGTQERQSQIAPALRGAGAEVIEAADSEDAALALGGRVPSGLLFPSSASVRAVTEYLARLRDDGRKPLVAAMGDASGAAASEAGFPPDVIATEPTAAAFVQGVTQYVLSESGASFPA
jgi:hydroxymethylbilane synthase